MVARSVEAQGLARPTDRYAPVHQHPVDKLALPSSLQTFRRILRTTNDPPDRLLNGLHLQHLPIRRQVSYDLLQPTVLVFKLLQPLHLGRQQPAIPLLPVEIGRLADPSLTADLSNLRAFLTCLRMNAFCASVNFDVFIVLNSSPSREMLAENSGFKRSSSQGAGHGSYVSGRAMGAADKKSYHFFVLTNFYSNIED